MHSYFMWAQRLTGAAVLLSAQIALALSGTSTLLYASLLQSVLSVTAPGPVMPLGPFHYATDGALYRVVFVCTPMLPWMAITILVFMRRSRPVANTLLSGAILYTLYALNIAAAHHLCRIGIPWRVAHEPGMIAIVIGVAAVLLLPKRSASRMCAIPVPSP